MNKQIVVRFELKKIHKEVDEPVTDDDDAEALDVSSCRVVFCGLSNRDSRLLVINHIKELV